jgi:hypothetical protein
MTSKIKIKIASLCSGFCRNLLPCFGSILLEAAIAISIVSLIAGFFATKTILANRALRIQVTKNNLETITVALASFLAHNSRLPAPAVNGGGGVEANAYVGDLAAHIGMVPFNTLGIPEKSTIDGNGRPIIYAVEPFLTQQFSQIYRSDGNFVCNDFFCASVANPKIVIQTQASEVSSRRDLVAFALDTADNIPTISDSRILVKISTNTAWIQRDMLLVKYLKACPCESRGEMHNNSVEQPDQFGNAAESTAENNASYDPFTMTD